MYALPMWRVREMRPIETGFTGKERDMALLAAGTRAPDIEGTTGTGKAFRLSDHLASTRVMLVFYPKDFTPGCTTQLSNVQKSLEDIRAAGVEPFGINPDDADSHKRFCDAYDLAFDLIVDEDGSAARAFGAVKPEGGILRSVFVIDKDGTVVYAQEGAPSWDDVASAIG
jgi:peroxiredoxin Q/BCP